MKIGKASFVTSITGNQSFPGIGLPQVTVVGKSNVGKSSLINTLANQNKLARTSQKPGHTRLINVYDFNDQFHLIDLPGYGFAKVPEAEKEKWAEMINDFLLNSEHQVRFLHLVDIRHEPGELDKHMSAWIQQIDIPCTIVATKADKLSKSQAMRAVSQISKSLGVDPSCVVPFSAVNKQGKDQLLNLIEKSIS